MAEKKKKASNSSMRLDKFLVEMGKGSRSQIKEMAKKGRIQVNGTVIKATDGKIDPEKDVVLLDGQPVSYAHTEYFMLNKPAGTVSATEDGEISYCNKSDRRCFAQGPVSGGTSGSGYRGTAADHQRRGQWLMSCCLRRNM